MAETTAAGPHDGRHWTVIEISGRHAESFLDRMLSNTVADLDSTRAAGAFILQPTGRIVSGGVFVRNDDGYLVLTAPDWAQALVAGLEKYKVAEDVVFAIHAQTARLLLAPTTVPVPAQPYGVVRSDDGIGVRIPWTGLDEVVWIGDIDAPTPDPETLTAERIAAGTPAFGAELRTDVIPLEANAYDWLSHTKGCYVGQEVVERMWSRGRAAKRLAGFRGDAQTPPDLPCKLQGDGRATLTSSAVHPELGRIALGFASTVAETTWEGDGTRWEQTTLPMAAERVLPVRQPEGTQT